MTLPRGLQDQTYEQPIATARWANEAEVAQYKYKSGDLAIGYINVIPDKAKPIIAKLDQLEAHISREFSQTHPDYALQQINQIASLRASLCTERMPVGFNDNRHILTKAGSRSGKGVSAIIPNLCIYPGSSVVLDPKGENANATAARRGKGSDYCPGMGQSVHVLDPFNTSNVAAEYRATFNVLDLLVSGDDGMIDKATSIADALIVKANDKDAHFDENARELVKAIILYVCLAEEEKDNRNLLRVLQLLRSGLRDQEEVEIEDDDSGEPPDYFRMLLDKMGQETGADGAVSGIATAMLDITGNEYGAILSTARRNLAFLEKPGMRRVLSESSFNVDDLKTSPEGMTLYLCLPPTRMADCSRWLRLMIATILDRLYSVEVVAPDGHKKADDETATGHPILFVLEEFPVLGYMQLLETAAGFAAGYGIKLWLIIQDLSQLKRHYKAGWETFIGNAGVVQAFGNSDNTTLEYLSKKAGETQTIQTTTNTTASETVSSNDASDYAKTKALIGQGGMIRTVLGTLAGTEDQKTTSYSTASTQASSPQIQHSPLLRPDEFERVFRREALTQCIMIKGERPIACMRDEYFRSPEYLGLFTPDRAPFRTLGEAQKEAMRLQVEQAKNATKMQEAAESYVQKITQALNERSAQS